MRKFGWIALSIAATLGYSAAAYASSDDAAEGEKIFKRTCASCHVTAKDGPKRLGPTLFGVIGRHSGSVEGFRYSEANKKADITWTPEILDKYLTDPKAMIPGTTMSFAGLKKAEERQHIISYLKTLK
ncbi:MAG: cytochrome c family protein [Rhodospirillales bacterium]|nr:cytochrome c family protein [Rhodospirillales bacterium]